MRFTRPVNSVAFDQKLGVTDENEAKRMMELLGGEVGTERTDENDAKGKKSGKRGALEILTGKKRGRRVDVAGDEEEERIRGKSKSSGPYPGDDPTVAVKLGYAERVKMDQYSGQMVFEVKTSMQVIASIFSFFREPVDYVNPRFVTKRLNEYYNKVERLVNSTRNLFPKNNNKRNNQLKRASPFVYKYWM